MNFGHEWMVANNERANSTLVCCYWLQRGDIRTPGIFTHLLANVGTLVIAISKIAEHPGPTVKLVTENDRGPKSIYYLLKMFSNVPHVSMEVISRN